MPLKEDKSKAKAADPKPVKAEHVTEGHPEQAGTPQNQTEDETAQTPVEGGVADSPLVNSDLPQDYANRLEEAYPATQPDAPAPGALDTWHSSSPQAPISITTGSENSEPPKVNDLPLTAPNNADSSEVTGGWTESYTTGQGNFGGSGTTIDPETGQVMSCTELAAKNTK